VRDDGAVQPLELGVAVLQQLQVVPEICRELLELRPSLRQLRLLASQALLDVRRARVELVQALLGERHELLRVKVARDRGAVVETACQGARRVSARVEKNARRSVLSRLMMKNARMRRSVRSPDISRERRGTPTFSFCAMSTRTLVLGVGGCAAPSPNRPT
jgi:hypothetical protein